MSTDYYYAGNSTNNNTGNIANNIVSSLISALLGSPSSTGGIKSSATQLNAQLTAPGDFTTFIQNPSGATSTPNAHLNYLFFDENFNPISYDANTGLGSGAKPVGASAVNTDPQITPFTIKVPANGYAFVYVSNNSNIDVWFDNLEISHQRGRILQENHYYPYGLQIASISAKAAGKMDNMYRYQGAYSEFEEETGWNDFELRTYDAQIGRWTGVDPYDQFDSPYIGMGNDPVNGVDPDGGLSIPYLFATTAMGAGIGYLTSPKGEKGKGALIGAGIGLGVGIVSNIALNGIMDYADPFAGNYASDVYKNYSDYFDKYTKYFADGSYWSRSFDAWVNDRLSDLFSSNFHFLSAVTNSKYSWIVISELSSKIIKWKESVTPSRSDYDYDYYSREYLNPIINQEYNYKGMAKSVYFNIVNSNPESSVDINYDNKYSEALNRSKKRSKFYKPNKTFKIEYDTGLKNDEFRTPKTGNTLDEVIIKQPATLRVNIKVKNNRVY